MDVGAYLKDPGTGQPYRLGNGAQAAASSQSVTPATDGSAFPVVSRGGATLATSQQTVGTAATQIVAARVGRGAVTITNTSTTPVYIGNAGVGTTTGAFLPGAVGASMTIPFNGAVFGVTATGTTLVTSMEVA